MSAHTNQNSLLATLVQHKTLPFISRAPLRNHSHTAGYDESTNPQGQRSEHLHLQNPSSNGVHYQTTHLQLPRTGYLRSQDSSYGGHHHQSSPQMRTVRNSSSQVHSQFQNVRPPTTIPPLQIYNQGQQQTWRPRSDRLQ